MTNLTDRRVGELVLRWNTDLDQVLFLAPFRPSEQRIRDGGPPLIQDWTKWVRGPGRERRAGGHHLARLGPAAAGRRADHPDPGHAPAGAARSPSTCRCWPARRSCRWRTGRRRSCASPSARHGRLTRCGRSCRPGPIPTRASMRAWPMSSTRSARCWPRWSGSSRSPASGSPTSAPGSGTTRCCSPAAPAAPTASRPDAALLDVARERAERGAPAQHPHRRGRRRAAAAARRGGRHRALRRDRARTTAGCPPSTRRCACCARAGGWS